MKLTLKNVKSRGQQDQFSAEKMRDDLQASTPSPLPVNINPERNDLPQLAYEITYD